MKYSFIFICLVSVFINIALAATNYTISQGAPVALHEKPSDKSAITALLDPGMHVNVTDQKQTQGFILVNTADDIKGWIIAKRLELPLNQQTSTNPNTISTPSLLVRLKSTLGFTEPKALAKAPTVPVGRRDQIINQYSQLQGAYLQLQKQRQQSTFILGVITLLIGIIIGLWINKYRYNRNRW